MAAANSCLLSPFRQLLEHPIPQDNLRGVIAKWVSFQGEDHQPESTRFEPLFLKGRLQIGPSLNVVRTCPPGGAEEMKSMTRRNP